MQKEITDAIQPLFSKVTRVTIINDEANQIYESKESDNYQLLNYTQIQQIMRVSDQIMAKLDQQPCRFVHVTLESESQSYYYLTSQHIMILQYSTEQDIGELEQELNRPILEVNGILRRYVKVVAARRD